MDRLPPEINEALTSFRSRRQWLTGIVVSLFALTVIISLTLFLALTNASAVSALKLDFDTVQAAQKAQAKASANFIRAFLAEQNYLCEITMLRAERDRFPLPPEGTCNVTVGR